MEPPSSRGIEGDCEFLLMWLVLYERSTKSMQNMDMRMVRGSVKARGSVAAENSVYNASGTVGLAYRKIATERRDRYIKEY